MIKRLRWIFFGLFFHIVTFPSVCAQSVTVPAGEFQMGDGSGEQDERPLHAVRISSFRINKFEVTAAQYDSCVRAGVCSPAHYDDGKCLIWNGTRFQNVTVPQAFRRPDYPVVCVTWHQARAYCRWKKMKLPSEAQWEYAARAGTRNVYSWGDSGPSPQRCVMPEKRCPDEAGSHAPNGWGLFDMTGNVWEWTNDYYDQQYYSFSDSQDPPGPDVGLYRVIRGGGWYSGPAQLRIANRHWFSPDYAEASIGFRCVE